MLIIQVRIADKRSKITVWESSRGTCHVRQLFISAKLFLVALLNLLGTTETGISTANKSKLAGRLFKVRGRANYHRVLVYWMNS